jgi:hypothetical protein
VIPTISGLALWVRADRGLVQSGSLVEHWLDQSGQGNTLDWVTDKPIVVSDNGMVGVAFNGTSQALVNRSALGIAPGAPRTFVVLARLSDPGTRVPLIVQTSPNASGNDAYGIEANTWRTAGHLFGVYLNGTSFDTSQASDTGYDVHVLRAGALSTGDVVVNAANYRWNGVTGTIKQKSFGNGTSPQTPTPTETSLGAFNAATAYIYGACTIVEAAVYGRALTDAEVSSIEADLKARHGL